MKSIEVLTFKSWLRQRYRTTLLVSSVLFDALVVSQMVFVTGGGELVMTSEADSITLSKVRFEVLGYTKLILDLPPTTITGFEKSVSTTAT